MQKICQAPAALSRLHSSMPTVFISWPSIVRVRCSSATRRVAQLKSSRVIPYTAT